MIKTLEWTDDGVRFIDQTKLPTEEVYVTCKDYEEVATAIRDMVVRGAPAIGVAAAMGIALGVRDAEGDHVSELRRNFDQICDTIGETRPTAVNLFWAIRRMQDRFEQLSELPVAQIKQAMVTEAQRMYLEDIAANEAMGRHGAVLLPSSGGVLTHCNAGALGDLRLRHGARSDSGGGRVGQEDSRLRRRDAPVPAGLAADGLGVGEGQHSDDGDLRQHGGSDDAPGQDRGGRRRRRSHRRER